MVNSSDDYFEAVRTTIDDLRASGSPAEAGMLQKALGYINGLTDGWAAFLGVLIEIESGDLSKLTQAQRQRLKELTDGAYKAVYRQDR